MLDPLSKVNDKCLVVLEWTNIASALNENTLCLANVELFALQLSIILQLPFFVRIFIKRVIRRKEIKIFRDQLMYSSTLYEMSTIYKVLKS